MICRNVKCGAQLPEGTNFCPRCGKKVQLPGKKTKSRGNGLGSVYKLPNGKYCAEKTLGWIADPLPPDAPPGTKPHKRRVKVKRIFEKKKDAVEALGKLSFADRRPRAGTATARKGKKITLNGVQEAAGSNPVTRTMENAGNLDNSRFPAFSFVIQKWPKMVSKILLLPLALPYNYRRETSRSWPGSGVSSGACLGL